MGTPAPPDSESDREAHLREIVMSLGVLARQFQRELGRLQKLVSEGESAEDAPT